MVIKGNAIRFLCKMNVKLTASRYICGRNLASLNYLERRLTKLIGQRVMENGS